LFLSTFLFDASIFSFALIQFYFSLLPLYFTLNPLFCYYEFIVNMFRDSFPKKKKAKQFQYNTYQKKYLMKNYVQKGEGRGKKTLLNY